MILKSCSGGFLHLRTRLFNRRILWYNVKTITE